MADTTLLRMAESNLLRAGAAVERHMATGEYISFLGVRNEDGEDRWNKTLHRLKNEEHEARAALLEVQADHVLHNEPEEGK